MKWIVVAGILLALCASFFAVEGAGSKPKAEPPKPPESALEQALVHYNQGLAHRDRGIEFGERATATPEDKRDKIERKSTEAFEAAREELTQATTKNPKFHEAYSALGYVSRRLGDYEYSIQAYDRALALDPEYAEAIEYRGEAYLALNRLDDVMQAYESLRGLDRERAAMLMDAMRGWVEQRRQAPNGVDSASLDAFEQWLEGFEGLVSGHSTAPGEKARAWSRR